MLRHPFKAFKRPSDGSPHITSVFQLLGEIVFPGTSALVQPGRYLQLALLESIEQERHEAPLHPVRPRACIHPVRPRACTRWFFAVIIVILCSIFRFPVILCCGDAFPLVLILISGKLATVVKMMAPSAANASIGLSFVIYLAISTAHPDNLVAQRGRPLVVTCLGGTRGPKHALTAAGAALDIIFVLSLLRPFRLALGVAENKAADPVSDRTAPLVLGGLRWLFDLAVAAAHVLPLSGLLILLILLILILVEDLDVVLDHRGHLQVSGGEPASAVRPSAPASTVVSLRALVALLLLAVAVFVVQVVAFAAVCRSDAAGAVATTARPAFVLGVDTRAGAAD
mmetsp:Transcript_25034/g.60229  ORF Transcript_25034/g.60229 Transcript_25034/m.60229 type:complete len:341 (+) Transcript_25034:1356-2378(+)